MIQYLELLNKIKKEGEFKNSAREGMPKTLSLFGYQLRHKLEKGFPLLTTKEIDFKNIVVELLWFLKGDTNIKYLVDHKCNIWNEDAYNYYLKTLRKFWSKGLVPYNLMFCEENGSFREFTFEEFVEEMKKGDSLENIRYYQGYSLGDCGEQYGKLWREWNDGIKEVDQLMNLIIGLKTNPTSRRHIITAWNPSSIENMALPACHSFVQFNCRPMSMEDKIAWVMRNTDVELENLAITERAVQSDVPQYKLDCQLYQRSADVFLGVPYNIASYSLLIHIISEICNFVPGEFIHTFGDTHLYEDHIDAANKQQLRTPRNLPELKFSEDFEKELNVFREEMSEEKLERCLNYFINKLSPQDFQINAYNPHSKIKVKLSTGLR